jgi:hypothetical protein
LSSPWRAWGPSSSPQANPIPRKKEKKKKQEITQKWFLFLFFIMSFVFFKNNITFKIIV